MCRCRLSPLQYKEQSRKRYLKQKPPTLPKRRARDALSPPPKEYKVTKRPRSCKKNTAEELCLPRPQSTQDESLLLGMLPAEVRLQIWAEVVGGKTIHILRKMGKLGHTICTGKDCEHCPGFVPTFQQGVPPRETEPFSKEKELSSSSFLPLLSTCRQIYSEAIPLLYTTNTFDFPHVWNLDFFRLTTLPRRFASIRTLALTHRFESAIYEFSTEASAAAVINHRFAPLIPHPSYEENWATAVKNLNALSALRNLEFRISRTAFRNKGVVAGGVQKPLADLAGLSQRLVGFKISVPAADEWYAVDAQLMQKGLEGLGVRCSVVQDVREPVGAGVIQSGMIPVPVRHMVQRARGPRVRVLGGVV